MTKKPPVALEHTDSFLYRHLGPRPHDCERMLEELGYKTNEALLQATVPSAIRMSKALDLGPGRSEYELLAELKEIASKNQIFRNFIGMGYAGCVTPSVIQRNILENPGWYTQYTPYQAEIAQGRLEALLNFQTMIMELTGLPISNSSMLDESTAAAEAMTMCFAIKGRDTSRAVFVSQDCHPQTIDVLKTRAWPLGIEVVVGDHKQMDLSAAGTRKKPVFGAILQYPATDGTIHDYRTWINRAHQAGALVVVAADILSLAVLTPPGEFGADVVVGSSQRFGVPLGYGGPHAAFFATRDEFKRQIPGRLVGVSKDVDGKNAVRLALQTREQHIRRDKATSNICTSQVLLAVVASMYAVYHGPEGVKAIAERVHLLAAALRLGLSRLGYDTGSEFFFDTVRVSLAGEAALARVLAEASVRRINLRTIDSKTVGIAIDETHSAADLVDLFSVFAKASGRIVDFSAEELAREVDTSYPEWLSRKSAYLTHPIFNKYRSETEMLRYMRKLESRDLSLGFSMIPLGSCTMKLNATTEMVPITWPEFNALHPFAPTEQAQGYQLMLKQLQGMLAEVTGFDAISLQPNAGSQGEYAGLLVIHRYHQSRGEGHRDVCLIPRSAHGTNPASAAMAGMKVVVVECDSGGNVDLNDLRATAAEHRDKLSALMVTYPSTHGVFEEGIVEICRIVHENGGQVYMDGANMNAQIGLCRPGEFGPDVCHLNLHKTFAIPHGGGGPGVGPIGVKSHLAPFLPTHTVVSTGVPEATGIGPIAQAPWGSASILPISWMYISLMGAEGLRRATEVAILNANYVAKRLDEHYPVLFRGKNGNVAHECIFDCRQFKDSAGIEVEDIAKRLMDYGFHAPTVSFPVPGTIMVEPTESESKEELDCFCDALIAIRQEIAEIEHGEANRQDNLLKNAPHTARQIAVADWKHPYSRERAAFPAPWTRENKFWPAVGRINNVLGDRNLVCACPPVDDYA